MNFWKKALGVDQKNLLRRTQQQRTGNFETPND